ncbi:hypothetical protein ERJ75_001475300 [Trypanosoma vivax]|nr:hypothetical protein ERJ75_001475300 [Trypanosoma vivax]
MPHARCWEQRVPPRAREDFGASAKKTSCSAFSSNCQRTRGQEQHGTTLAVNKAATLRHGGTLARMAANLTQAIDATSTQGKKGQCSNAAKLLCDASATDFEELVAGARAEAAAAAQQANEELAANEGPHDTEETGAENRRAHRGEERHKASNKRKRKQGRTPATKHTKTRTARRLGPTRNPPRAA